MCGYNTEKHCNPEFLETVQVVILISWNAEVMNWFL